MTNKKKTVVVAIMGRLVKKTPSRHYWLYDGEKHYQVARLYDVHQSGHYEFINAEFSTKGEAIAFANKLNEEGVTDIAQATKMAKTLSEPKKSNTGVIVKSKNAVKIANVLDAANGQSSERLADCTDVALAVDTLDRKFKGINKEGLVIDVNPHVQSFAHNYRGIPMVTTFVLLYKYGKWRLMSSNRVPCGAVRFRVLKIEQKIRYSILRQYETF